MDSIIIFCAKYLIGFIVLLFGWSWLRTARSKKVEMASAVIIAGVLALAIARITSKLYYDPRPFVSGNVRPLIQHAADNGFPSDHTLLSATLTGVLYFYNRTWAGAALLLTLAIGLARILAHVHSPIDILGSLVIGTAAAYAGHWAASGYFLKRSSAKN